MAKTVKELREELSNLLSGIMQVNSSFAIANLSQKIVKVAEEWKEAKELEEAQKSKPEPKPEPKKCFGDIKFDIPLSAVMISEENGYRKERFIRFFRINTLKNSGYDYAGEFCIEILKNLFETTPEAKTREIEESIIKIFEEKFGLTIKICGNCRNFVLNTGGMGLSHFHCCELGVIDNNGEPINTRNKNVKWREACDKFLPKEVSVEKK